MILVQLVEIKRFRKQAVPEATISNLKQHYRLGECYLKAELGDQINVTMAAAAYSKCQWSRLRLDSFFKDQKLRISQHLISSNFFLKYTFSY